MKNFSVNLGILYEAESRLLVRRPNDPSEKAKKKDFKKLFKNAGFRTRILLTY